MFCSDVRYRLDEARLILQDHWVLDRMKRRATRLSVISVRDIDRRAAERAILTTRAAHFDEDKETASGVASRLLELVGGRIAHIHRCAGRCVGATDHGRFAARPDAAAAAEQAIGTDDASVMLTPQMLSASTCCRA